MDEPSRPSSGSKRFPVLYLSHGGGPWPVMSWKGDDPWSSLRAYLQGVATSLPQEPRAIVMFSAHWEEAAFHVQAASKPPLFYDYSGFPPETYQIDYPLRGEPQLAQRVATLLAKAGLHVSKNEARGYDHGTFVPLMVMYPRAHIPVVQLSLVTTLEPEIHIRAGQALSSLRDEGILLVASGSSFHNFDAFRRGEGYDKARQFDEWLTKLVEEHDGSMRMARLREWSSAPAARVAHPREEHLLPLMLAVGAAGEDRGRKTHEFEMFGFVQSSFEFSA